MTDSLTDRLGSAQSLLFVPGDRPERFVRALGSGADSVVVGLEDAVASQAKDAAVEHALELLGTPRQDDPTVLIRMADRPVLLRARAIRARAARYSSGGTR